jgi:hypothetical protein
MHFTGPDFPDTPGVYRLNVGCSFYIGSSVNLKERRRSHENRLMRHSQRCSDRLHSELERYGVGRWDVVQVCKSVRQARTAEEGILKTVIDNPLCLNSQHWVSIAKPHAQPTHWNGVVYESLAAAARESAFDSSTISDYIKKGYMSDVDIRDSNGFGFIHYCRHYFGGIEWNGALHKSFKEAAKSSKMSRESVVKWHKLGCRSDKDVKQMGTKIYWDGKVYYSLMEAFQSSGIDVSKATFAKWINRGHQSLADVHASEAVRRAQPKTGRQVLWNGVVYPSVTQAYKAWGNPDNLTVTSFVKYINRGAVSDETIVKQKRGRPRTK